MPGFWPLLTIYCDDIDPEIHLDAKESCKTDFDDNCNHFLNNEDSLGCRIWTAMAVVGAPLVCARRKSPSSLARGVQDNHKIRTECCLVHGFVDMHKKTFIA